MSFDGLALAMERLFLEDLRGFSEEDVKALHARRAAAGLTRHEHYYHKEDHEQVKEFVRNVNDERVKTNKEEDDFILVSNLSHLESANLNGWRKHPPYLWSRELNGKRLDYWASCNKFQYEGRVMTGDVVAAFINKRTKMSDFEVIEVGDIVRVNRELAKVILRGSLGDCRVAHTDGRERIVQNRDCMLVEKAVKKEIIE